MRIEQEQKSTNARLISFSNKSTMC